MLDMKFIRDQLDQVEQRLASRGGEPSLAGFRQLDERRRSLLLPLGPDGFRGTWANDSIEGFLDAALAWAEDADFGARPGPKSPHPWQLFASFLWAGRSYE